VGEDIKRLIKAVESQLKDMAYLVKFKVADMLFHGTVHQPLKDTEPLKVLRVEGPKVEGDPLA